MCLASVFFDSYTRTAFPHAQSGYSSHMKNLHRIQENDPGRLAEINQVFYQRLWASSNFYGPEQFNTWDVLSKLCLTAPRRLEVGPGLRPRLPIPGTVFCDVSGVACQHPQEAGGHIHVGPFETLQFPESSFDLTCLFDVIEHIPDDQAVFGQLSHLLADDGTLFLSVPLHAHAWTPFDALVGHYRRYDPDHLLALLNTHDFDIQHSAPFGMQPKSKLLSKLSTWWLRRHYEMAMYYHNRFFFPLGLKMQKKLLFKPGLTCDDNIDEVVVMCRRRPRVFIGEACSS